MRLALAIKSIKQPLQPSSELLQMMEIFRQMVNDCVRVGLEHNVSTMKSLCSIVYNELSCYDILSYYKLCAISSAAGILNNRKKSIKRGWRPRQPYASRPVLISCYGFKIEDDILKIPIGNARYHEIPLNNYVKNTLSNSSLEIRSFTLTPNSLAICYSKEVQEREFEGVMGVDRNLRNMVIGNKDNATQYDLSKAVEIAENTRSITHSFKRNDFRIRRTLYSKYGMRRKRRVNQLLHRLTKTIVKHAKQGKSAIVFEDIRHIRLLYQKGNYQGRAFRSRLNGWSFAEVKRQIEYKAKWEGVAIIRLSKTETRGTSQLCPQCGKKITQVDRLTRRLYCAECKKWMDRDVVAAMNIASKGLQRFCSSKGFAGEAMVQESGRKEPVILRVDASKLVFLRRTPEC